MTLVMMQDDLFKGLFALGLLVVGGACIATGVLASLVALLTQAVQAAF